MISVNAGNLAAGSLDERSLGPLEDTRVLCVLLIPGVLALKTNEIYSVRRTVLVLSAMEADLLDRTQLTVPKALPCLVP